MKNILIIDDEADLRSSLRRKLELAGLMVFEAESVDEAIKIIVNSDIHLILLDLIMPSGHGIGLIDKLKLTGKNNIPVIILSNVDSTSYPDSIKEYMIKSEVSLDQIVSRIKYHLEIKK